MKTNALIIFLVNLLNTNVPTNRSSIDKQVLSEDFLRPNITTNPQTSVPSVTVKHRPSDVALNERLPPVDISAIRHSVEEGQDSGSSVRHMSIAEYVAFLVLVNFYTRNCTFRLWIYSHYLSRSSNMKLVMNTWN